MTADLRTVVRGALHFLSGPLSIITSYIETEDEWIEYLRQQTETAIERDYWDRHLYFVLCPTRRQQHFIDTLKGTIPNSKWSGSDKYIYGKDAIPIRLNARVVLGAMRHLYLDHVPIFHFTTPTVYWGCVAPNPRTMREDDLFCNKATLEMFKLNAEGQWVRVVADGEGSQELVHVHTFRD